MSSSKPNRRAPLQSTDMDETEEDKSYRGDQQSLHNFDSSSIHTTDFLSTTTDVEEWPGMATNPNTPKVEQKSSRKPKKSVDTITDDEIMRKMSDMSITADDDDTNNSFYNTTPTNKRRNQHLSMDESASQHSATKTEHTKTGYTSTDMDSSRFDDGVSESNLSKSEASITPKPKERNKDKKGRDDKDKKRRDDKKHRDSSPRKEKSKSKQSIEAGSETASSRLRTTTNEHTESMSGTDR